MKKDIIIKKEEIVVRNFTDIFSMIWKAFSLTHLGTGMKKEDPNLREQKYS